jgi:excisionase family DNA binding protein
MQQVKPEKIEFVATPSTILTVRELAVYLRVHPTTVYRLLRTNQIPGFRVGSDWRFDMSMIDRWRSGEERAGARQRHHKGS